MEFEPWQWSLLVLGAITIGMAKTGIPGLGIMFVAIFANIMPAKQATGLVLPLLILADVVAVCLYRRHAVMKYVIRLLPWTAAGVILGTVALSSIDNRQAKVLVGAILMVMILIHVWKEWGRMGKKLESEIIDHAAWFAPVMGIAAGFTTQVANAAGPIMSIYLVSRGLLKQQFISTVAWFFFVINLIKVPIFVEQGMITPASLRLDLVMAPLVLLGAAVGVRIVHRIPQVLFNRLILIFSAVAALQLIWSSLRPNPL